MIKKYGTEGSHLEAQAEAISKLSGRRATAIESARAAAAKVELPKAEPEPTEAPAEETADAPAEGAAEAAAPEAAPAEATTETKAEPTEGAAAEKAE